MSAIGCNDNLKMIIMGEVEYMKYINVFVIIYIMI